MKQFILFIIIITLTSGIKANDDAMQDWVASLTKPWLIEQAELAAILAQFQQRYPDFQQRLKAISYWRLGTPYKIFNLGEEQAPDIDPIFRLDVSDCTSHILTSLSLSQSASWTDAREKLINIHYKANQSGVKAPRYEQRWHYTSDRIMNHPATPDLTSAFVDEDDLQEVTIKLNQKQDGTEFLALNWSLTTTVKYIPSDKITASLLANLPDFIGIAFVKKSYFKMGVVTAHEGMLIAGGKLLHAGQSAGKTVIEDFQNYYFKSDGAKYDGIMLYGFTELGDR